MKINDYKKLLIFSEIVLGILMVFFICFSLVSSHRSTVLDIRHDTELLADRHDAFFNQILFSARAFADKEKTDKKYSEYYRNDDIVSKLEIMEDIRAFRNTSTFFDYVFYIDGNDMSIIGVNGTYDIDYFHELYKGLDKGEFVSFLDSRARCMIIDSSLFSIPVTSIFMKSSSSSRSAFVFMVDRAYIEKFVVPVELDGILDEKIYYDGRSIFSTFPEGKSEPPLFASLNYGDFRFDFHLDSDWILSATLHNSAVFLFIVVLSWVICAYMLSYLMKMWYAPLDKVITHMGVSEEDAGKASTSDVIIDSYDELKAQSHKYATDVVLFRILFSGKYDEKVLSEYGIELNGAYYFFCLFSSEADSMLASVELEKLENTNVHRIYISENNIVSLVICHMDLVSLEKHLENLKSSFPNVTFSSVSDDARYLRYCYSNAEQERIASRMQDSVGYPYDEIRQLSVSMGMDNYERALFLYNQLMLIIDKADMKLKNDIMYDMAKILAKSEDRATLRSIRYNRSRLESMLMSCKERLISECNLREKRSDRKRMLERNIDSIEAYVKEHCMERDYSLKRLAFEFNMSYSNFCHYYKDNTGHTITEFTDLYKIEKAKILMSSGMKIYDVSARLGYNSPQTFSRVFKKYEGQLPKAYMMENNGNAAEAGKDDED